MEIGGLRQPEMPAVAAGALKLPSDSVFAVNDLKAAFARMAANKDFGKIVLKL